VPERSATGIATAPDAASLFGDPAGPPRRAGTRVCPPVDSQLYTVPPNSAPISHTVEYCISNVERRQRRELEDASNVTAALVEKPCLHRCDDCARMRYVVLDGEFVPVGEDRTLLEEVRASG